MSKKKGISHIHTYGTEPSVTKSTDHMTNGCGPSARQSKVHAIYGSECVKGLVPSAYGCEHRCQITI